MTKYKWGKNSLERLEHLSPLLRKVLDRALSYGIMDMSIIETVRSKEDQNVMFEMGLSKLQWPNSSHNLNGKQKYSRAVDVYPYMNGKSNLDGRVVGIMVGIIMAAAKEEGVDIISGYNWDNDGVWISDQKFQDGVHFELVTV